ncbi:hypothetical protein ARMGADRAFT_1037808 [Armillaria gallica]|uniref:Uncharacterized protein n=1 Tax=Armillaria gallica TaxID=47427 RepID=A0A2H3CKT4_ARMGA|nr:hypothetical protein ARMGADRAFT_1037808 [Armillaria gallica]
MSSACRFLQAVYHPLLWKSFQALPDLVGSDSVLPAVAYEGIVTHQLIYQCRAIVADPALGGFVRSIFMTLINREASYSLPLLAQALRLMPKVQDIHLSGEPMQHSLQILCGSLEGVFLSSVRFLGCTFPCATKRMYLPDIIVGGKLFELITTELLEISELGMVKVICLPTLDHPVLNAICLIGEAL